MRSWPGYGPFWHILDKTKTSLRRRVRKTRQFSSLGQANFVMLTFMPGRLCFLHDVISGLVDLVLPLVVSQLLLSRFRSRFEFLTSWYAVKTFYDYFLAPAKTILTVTKHSFSGPRQVAVTRDSRSSQLGTVGQKIGKKTTTDRFQKRFEIWF